MKSLEIDRIPFLGTIDHDRHHPAAHFGSNCHVLTVLARVLV